MSKRVPVYLSVEEMKEIVRGLEMAYYTDWDRLIAVLKEEIERNNEGETNEEK